MNFGLSDEQEMIVSTVREFVEREIYPHETQVERTGGLKTEASIVIGKLVTGNAEVQQDGIDAFDFKLVKDLREM